MKAIIPVAGAGTKLRPHTYTQPKALIPLAGRSILSIIVDQLLDGGIKDFVFIVGYLGEKIQDYVKKNYPDLNASFVVQQERQGLGHAIYLTKEAVGADEVFIVLGDSICEYDVHAILEQDHSMVGVKKVDDPRNFGVAEVDEFGFALRMVEKPQIPKSNLALVGIYKIKESELLYSCLEENMKEEIAANEEYNLTDAIEGMLRKGANIETFKVQNWFDCGQKKSLLASNTTLLKKLGNSIAEGSVFENTIIVPPVSIAAGCVLTNCIIGPNAAIGEHTKLKSSIIKNSIIGSYANLTEIVLTESLIGSDTEVIGESRSLNIGDNTEIDLGRK